MNLLNINKLKLTSSIREENLRQCIRRKLDVKKNLLQFGRSQTHNCSLKVSLT